MPAVMNAANEIAVEAFLREQIPFNAIPTLIARVMEMHDVQPVTALSQVLSADAWARQAALAGINQQPDTSAESLG